MQWIVTAVIAAGGVFLVFRGVHGFQNEVIVGRFGRVHEGTGAKVRGVIWTSLGVLIAIVAIARRLKG